MLAENPLKGQDLCLLGENLVKKVKFLPRIAAVGGFAENPANQAERVGNRKIGKMGKKYE